MQDGRAAQGRRLHTPGRDSKEGLLRAQRSGPPPAPVEQARPKARPCGPSDWPSQAPPLQVPHAPQYTCAGSVQLLGPELCTAWTGRGGRARHAVSTGAWLLLPASKNGTGPL